MTSVVTLIRIPLSMEEEGIIMDNQDNCMENINKDGKDIHNSKRFIIVGNDRFRLSDIHSYGIKNGVSYLVKNSNQVQVSYHLKVSVTTTLNHKRSPCMT